MQRTSSYSHTHHTASDEWATAIATAYATPPTAIGTTHGDDRVPPARCKTRASDQEE